MRKIVSLLMIAMSITATVEFYSTMKKSADNFAMCGTSLEQSHDDSTGVELNINTGNIQMRNQMNMQLKETSTHLNDHMNHSWFHVQIPSNHTLAFFLSLEEMNVDSLFLASIFKPPKA